MTSPSVFWAVFYQTLAFYGGVSGVFKFTLIFKRYKHFGGKMQQFKSSFPSLTCKPIICSLHILGSFGIISLLSFLFKLIDTTRLEGDLFFFLKKDHLQLLIFMLKGNDHKSHLSLFQISVH